MSATTTSLHAAGVTSALLLSGVYFGSSQITVPALYRLPSRTSTSVFTEFYYRGLVVVVPLALVSTVSSALVAYRAPFQRSVMISAGSLVIGTLVWTRAVMMGTIQRLLDAGAGTTPGGKMGDAEVVRLLKQWKWMNFVRSGLSMAGGVLGMWALLA